MADGPVQPLGYTMTDRGLTYVRSHEADIMYHPQPGERCWGCNRRVPKKRQRTSPETKRIVATLPPDRAEALLEGLDNLQEYVGADPESYPRGTVLELLLALGAHHREELKAHFTERVVVKGGWPA